MESFADDDTNSAKEYSDRNDTVVINQENKNGAGEKDNQCNVCKKSFTCPSTLRKHMKRHTGEKTY